MHRRNRGIFRGAGIGVFVSLLLGGCSGANAPFKTSSQRRAFSAQEESPPFNLTQRKRQMISAGGLEAPETGTTLGGNLLVNGDFSAGLRGWHASVRCFRPDSSTRAPNGKPSLKLENPGSCRPSAKLAVNEVVAPPGIYSVGGEIKTSELIEAERLVLGAPTD